MNNMDNVIPFQPKQKTERRVVFLDPKDQEWTLMFAVGLTERISVTAHPDGVTLTTYNIVGNDSVKNEVFLTYDNINDLIPRPTTTND